MDAVNLRVSVPICSFRKPYAREYLETERVPFPSTVYGFLLSLIGEEDRNKYIGTNLAIAITKSPLVSTVLRTVWRVKDKKYPPGTGNNRRPDYQELLTGLEIAVWVSQGGLADKLNELCKSPCSIIRYGGLSLGESRDLVDEVEFYPKWYNQSASWLINDRHGQYPLPIWVDHIGSKGTRWGQFSLDYSAIIMPGDNDLRWIIIAPPAV